MLIDWFTVGAQIINFLILIYLLKRFLYQPILKAMDERERKISGRLQEAAEKREKAETEAESLAEERRQLEKNREKMQKEARAEIDSWRDEAMEKARQEVENKRNSWQENIAREKDDFIHRMKVVLSRQVFRAAAKAVQDLAGESFEAGLVRKFKDKLSDVAVDKEEGKHDRTEELRLMTGFELSGEQQDDLKKVVAGLFPEAEPVFEVEPEMGYTIRLIGDNRKMEWGLGRYMDEMEEEILHTMHLVQGEKS